MLLVLVLLGAIWFGGDKMGIARETRLSILGLVFIAVLGLQILLPETNPLRQATGGSAGLWLVLGGFSALFWIYRRGLLHLRARASAYGPEDEKKPMTFSDTELKRYARHIVLREIGGSGQKAMKNAKVLVIGAGGLGAPALQYLAAAGVGTLGVVDDDVVENTNLHRQVIHIDANIGMPKVFSAQAQIEAQNPFVTVRPYHRRLSIEIAEELIAEYDLVLDGTDNFETRYLVNAACVATAKPLVSGALSQWEGQISVFDPARGAPCYQCIFPQVPDANLAPSCAEAGVIGPLPGVVGSMMAIEAIKVITGAGSSARGKMLIYDALYGENRTIQIARRSDCPTCGTI
ncbi:molybdopterin-synthase adenylyltransferase MoeB [Sulfitobacter sp. F26204]|uniref:HesA/MoeB/ThiF family protein n=1 Tax=Sulfitobacter sp. F26204 TaxID=2996014 RepID=UPI00225DEF82|nr:molybdopterin-synthase adenylyltransferase MoeB [Sulfitobacter sp. F26204]MCX7560324.1 molybdopterin-synthase adenylyltransferase MoeB [Sulfitobacter sp. F26204]